MRRPQNPDFPPQLPPARDDVFDDIFRIGLQAGVDVEPAPIVQSPGAILDVFRALDDGPGVRLPDAEAVPLGAARRGLPRSWIHEPNTLRQVRVVNHCPKGKGTRIFSCPATQNFSHRHLNQSPPLHRR